MRKTFDAISPAALPSPIIVPDVNALSTLVSMHLCPAYHYYCIPLVVPTGAIHHPRHNHRLDNITRTGDEEERHVLDLHCDALLRQKDNVTYRSKRYSEHQEEVSVVELTASVARGQAEGARNNVQRDTVDLSRSGCVSKLLEKCRVKVVGRIVGVDNASIHEGSVKCCQNASDSSQNNDLPQPDFPVHQTAAPVDPVHPGFTLVVDTQSGK